MKKIIIVISIILQVTAVSAQETQKLTLEECRNKAIENNMSGAQAKEVRLKALYTKRSLLSNFLPKLSVSGDYIYSTGKFNYTMSGGYLPTFVPGSDGTLVPNVISGTAIFKEYAYMPDIAFDFKIDNVFLASAIVEQPVYMGGKIVAGYKMGKLGEELAVLNESLTKEQIIVATDEAYWNCVRAKEMTSAAKKYKEVVDEFLRNVENAVADGMKSKNDLMKVRVKVNEAELNLLKAENAIRLSRMNLCYVIGLPMDEQIEIAEDDIDANENISSSDYDVTARYEYRMLDKQVELKKQEVRLTRADFLPNIGIAASYGYMNGLKLNGDRLIDNSSFIGMATVKIPLFHWGEGYNKVRAAKADYRTAEIQKEDGMRKMELEINQCFNNVTEARCEVALMQRSLDQSAENLRVSKDSYDAGLETTADYLEAQTLWQKAWADLIDAKSNLRISEIKYLKSTGRWSNY